jgi:hypothetical protein
LIKAPLEVFMDIIQNRIAANFGYSNDAVMESLRKCLERLQDDRMALPPQSKKGEATEFGTLPQVYTVAKTFRISDFIWRLFGR